MKKILSEKEIRNIIKEHQLWLAGDDKNGKRADFSECNLNKFDFTNMDLRFAIFRYASLIQSKFIKTKLMGADFSCADLHGSKFRESSIQCANFESSNMDNTSLKKVNGNSANFSFTLFKSVLISHSVLKNAIFTGSNMPYASFNSVLFTNSIFYNTELVMAKIINSDINGVIFTGANLEKSIIQNNKINNETTGLAMVCPEEGSFIGYKKAKNNIVVLEITRDAKRCSSTTLKCRCSKAKVLRIEDLNDKISVIKSIPSDYDQNFIYEVGKIVEVPDFDENRWNECSNGIHFFINKEVAKNYSL